MGGRKEGQCLGTLSVYHAVFAAICGQQNDILRRVSIPHCCFRRAVGSNIGFPLCAPRLTSFSPLFTKTTGFLTQHTHNLPGTAATAALVHSLTTLPVPYTYRMLLGAGFQENIILY